MFKLALVLIGAAAGAAGATGWLLGFRVGANGGPTLSGTSLETVKVQFEAALKEGQRRGAETEERLRRELAAYRQGAGPRS